MVIFIGVNVYNMYKALDLQTFIVLALIAASGLLFLALIVTGGLFSLDLTLSGASSKIHQVAPLLALAASTITICLLVSGKS
ncbi:MAG TPA: hypothetical protein VLA49_01660 [Anaerolineales bacterium]|nr:hypothetical protein [Anaerolineales bacterium]